MSEHPSSRRFPLLPAVVLLTLALGPAGCDREGREAEARFEAVVDSYLTWHFADDPVRATRLGIHDHNHALPDLSREGQERRIRDLRQWLTLLEEVDRDLLGLDSRMDHRVLEYAIRGELLELEEIRWWTKNPSLYVGTVSGGIAVLVDRDVAPLEERVRQIMGRQSMIPHVLEAARANLEDVPELWAEQAVGAARGTARYLDRQLMDALEAQGFDDLPQSLKSQSRQATADAAVRMARFADWLEEDLLPRSDGDFRLGAELFERKLRYDEHVDLTVDELREINEREIERYHEWIAEVAARVDSGRTPRQIMDSITAIHPSPGELIRVADEYQRDLQAFIRENDVVTLPGDERPVVRETPEYARGGFASMSVPGPFETRATEAYYNITNVLPEWSEEEQRQHLTYFNYPGLLGITIHESFPGHFVDFLYRPMIESGVRRAFNWGSLSEGWAHYAEQMMVDEGVGGGNPAVRLGQLRRAIQRHARWYAGLEMHAFGETVEDATERYRQIAYFERFPALQEVERGTRNPTYLYYALGRMQILQLREDYREHLESRGETFSLREFHDRFLQIGLPVALARRIMIPGDDRPSIR